MSSVLMDASALVALFNPLEENHASYVSKVAVCAKNKQRLLSTWPCVTEASYLLSPRSHCSMLTWLADGSVDIHNFETGDLPEFLDAMQQYSEPQKTIMDLADASLYWLASKMGCISILTEDRRDFLRYRLPDGRAFEIL
jgi:uncharacterized protein